MPTVLRIGAYRFFFYAGDGSEPPHVHVEREDKTAKFWLNPVRLEESYGFQPHELNRIQYLIEEYRRNLLQRWEDFFHE